MIRLRRIIVNEDNFRSSRNQGSGCGYNILVRRKEQVGGSVLGAQSTTRTHGRWFKVQAHEIQNCWMSPILRRLTPYLALMTGGDTGLNPTCHVFCEGFDPTER